MQDYKISKTIYIIEATTEFNEIQITQDEKGFSFFISIPRTFGNTQYIVFKTCIIGAFEYLANRKSYDRNKQVVYFQSYEECIKAIKILDRKIIDAALDEAKEFSRKTFALIDLS